MGIKTFLALLKTLWGNRRIILVTALVEIRKRHAGSILGPAWILLYPALLLSMYLFVYMAVFKVKITGIANSYDYSLFVLCGIIPYLALSEVLNGAVLLLSQNRHLIANVIVPLEIIPVRHVVMSFISQGASLLILIVMLLFSGKASWAWLWLAPMLGLEFVFLAGASYLFATFGVLVRDLGQIIAIITLFLMFVSPIGFTVEMVPHWLRFTLYFNPLFYLVESFRQPLLYGRMPELLMLSIYTVVSFAQFYGGGVIFKKTLHTLSDLA